MNEEIRISTHLISPNDFQNGLYNLIYIDKFTLFKVKYLLTYIIKSYFY